MISTEERARVESVIAAARIYVFKKRRWSFVLRHFYALPLVAIEGLGTWAVTETGIIMHDPQVTLDYLQAAKTPTEAVEWIAANYAHEVLHWLLKHSVVAKMLGVSTSEQKQRANIAADCAIRCILDDAGFVDRGDGIHPSMFQLEERQSFPWYYANLPKQLSRKGGNGNGCGSGSGGEKLPGEPENHPASRSKAQQARDATDFAQAVVAAAKAGRGTVPDGLLQICEELLAPPKIHWSEKLRCSIIGALDSREGADTFAYTDYSELQAGFGYGEGAPVLPAAYRTKARVGLLVDTSGSMSCDNALSKALSEAAGILNALGSEVTVCGCDADVHALGVARSADDIRAALKGGGGTDMRPGIEALLRVHPALQMLVCLTDLDVGDPGPDPGIPMLWCDVNGRYEGQPAPGGWGELLVCKD